MQIKVSSTGNPRYENFIEANSLTFDLKSSTFEIPAGGYLIKTPEPFKPVSIHFYGTTCVLRFETPAEAVDFCEWYLSANQQASDSFTRMLD